MCIVGCLASLPSTILCPSHYDHRPNPQSPHMFWTPLRAAPLLTSPLGYRVWVVQCSPSALQCRALPKTPTPSPQERNPHLLRSHSTGRIIPVWGGCPALVWRGWEPSPGHFCLPCQAPVNLPLPRVLLPGAFSLHS